MFTEKLILMQTKSSRSQFLDIGTFYYIWHRCQCVSRISSLCALCSGANDALTRETGYFYVTRSCVVYVIHCDRLQGLGHIGKARKKN